MDSTMPVMDGSTAVRHIRATEGAFHIPIYMLTANVFESDIKAYQAAGADGVLTKPIQIDQLYACLGAAAEMMRPAQPAVAVNG
jgi:CheY-like chemotaxis protein